MPESAALFDVAAAWRTLSPDHQARIGVAAITAAFGCAGEATRAQPATAFEAATAEGLDALSAALEDALPEALDPPRRPDLSAIGVLACRVCGCTDRVGCAEGCSWVKEDLCSGCAEADPDVRR